MLTNILRHIQVYLMDIITLLGTCPDPNRLCLDIYLVPRPAVTNTVRTRHYRHTRIYCNHIVIYLIIYPNQTSYMYTVLF